MFDYFKNKFLYTDKYKTHSEAVIVSCFFNPQNSPYRVKAFKKFYESIKHLNYRIIECVIGDDDRQLDVYNDPNISVVYTQNVLWHKEALLNKVISELPKKYKYVFWVDADVIFTNNDWVVDGVKALQTANIIQPFELCVHLSKDLDKPSFVLPLIEDNPTPNKYNNSVWRSFCSNYSKNVNWGSEDYNTHGHVGFAWAARREVLEACPLYDRALIGGADHIIAHAAAGQINHKCIAKSFTENIDEVNEWSRKFYNVVQGKIGYVKGNLYHIWHGDINKRQYLKRIQDFTPTTKEIVHKDKNGLYITKKGDDEYVKKYFQHREVSRNTDDNFLNSMMIGYMTDSALMGTLLGGNPTGAMIGDMMNNSDKNGGSSGGGGATGDWKENDTQPIQDTTPVQNEYIPQNFDLNQNDSTITDSSHIDDTFS